ncbi:MAG: nucleoside-diphosphate sugar epimerase/dehydratase [Sarcina sp.]
MRKEGKNLGSGKKLRTVILLFVDMFVIFLAYLFSFYARFGGYGEALTYNTIFTKHLIVIIALYILPMALLRMYRSLWRIAGFEEFLRAGISVLLGLLLNIAYSGIVGTNIPVVLTILSGVLIGVAVISVRLSYRIIRRIILYGTIFLDKTSERVLVIGGGLCGTLVIDEMRKDPTNNLKPVAVIDDDINKANTFLRGLRVYGGRNKIQEAVEKEEIDMILIAIASLDSKNKKEIIKICNKTKKKVKIIPGMNEVIEGSDSKTHGVKSMRNVDLHDLLGRDEIKLDKTGINEYIEGKVVMVTGGGGSIGSELCRQIARYKPQLLLIVDIYENNAYEIQNELRMKYPNLKQHAIIASVRERWRMDKIFSDYKPQVVFHAAAHKHVPLMEFSPLEAIKNNIKGTYNTADLAYKYKVERFVLISTDKAVNPTNVMGATKRYCEMIIQGMHKKAIDEKQKSEFVAVRFGNVLGSNGSVIPLFKKQIEKGGPVTLTHKNITRYFMLIPEAVQLVLQAGGFAKGGEIFVLDMGEPVRIYDLAENLIKLSGFEPHKDIQIKEVGLRPGEKLYEELLMDEEGLTQTVHEKIFIAKPSEFEVEKLKADFYELIKIGEEKGDEALRERLHEMVPTYAFKNSNELKEVAVAKESNFI